VYFDGKGCYSNGKQLTGFAEEFALKARGRYPL
jgi:hypothetical protein